MQHFTFITSNPGKLEEVNRYWGTPVAHAALELEEIQSLNLEDIVWHKAMQAYAQLQKPVLVEDCSLVFNALGGLPGPFIKWFEHELGYEGLCRLLDGKDRSCVATVCYGFHDGNELRFVSGDMVGTIAQHPSGKGFGWAVIFIPDGMSATYAELSPEDRATIAMRRKAMDKLRSMLK